MRPVLRWLACMLIAAAAPASAALRFETRDADLSPAERMASHDILAGASGQLPAGIRDGLDRVEVQWRDDLPAHVAGRAYSTRIELDRRLLANWAARPASDQAPLSLRGDANANAANGTIDPAPSGATRAAFAAVIHELAHLYDRRTGLSSDPRLLDFAGWQVAPLKFGLRTSRSAFTDRTPDRYETDSPREFVAVNLEHLLLDPDYACRRPQLAAWFAQAFAMTSSTASCAPDAPFFEADATAPLLALPPTRVYAVDYLLAEGNDQPLSAWGHSMLRLVICAPGRLPGPDCRHDLAYHRVLSFRAFVDDVQVSSWRGLTGAYPSRLFVLPLSQVIGEYTQVQLRGLQSIPLRLEADEIASLLQRAAQVHWTYDGRYRFVDNNCAVETYKLLHDGVPRLAGARLSSITPKGLLRRLERAGIADASVLIDRGVAQRRGFYFESEGARYQALFDVVRARLGVPQGTVDAWWGLDAARRGAVIDGADLQASAALLLLEQAALRREEQAARDVLKRRLLDRRAGADERDAVQSLLDEDARFARPAALIEGGGYGLPQADERAQLLRTAVPRLQQQSQARDAMLAQAKAWLPAAQRRAFDDIDRNVAALGARLRRLNREQGGITLPP